MACFTISEVRQTGRSKTQMPFIKRLMARADDAQFYRSVWGNRRLARGPWGLVFLRRDGRDKRIFRGLAQTFHHLAASRHNT